MKATVSLIQRVRKNLNTRLYDSLSDELLFLENNEMQITVSALSLFHERNSYECGFEFYYRCIHETHGRLTLIFRVQ